MDDQPDDFDFALRHPIPAVKEVKNLPVPYKPAHEDIDFEAGLNEIESHYHRVSAALPLGYEFDQSRNLIVRKRMAQSGRKPFAAAWQFWRSYLLPVAAMQCLKFSFWTKMPKLSRCRFPTPTLRAATRQQLRCCAIADSTCPRPRVTWRNFFGLSGPG